MQDKPNPAKPAKAEHSQEKPRKQSEVRQLHPGQSNQATPHQPNQTSKQKLSRGKNYAEPFAKD